MTDDVHVIKSVQSLSAALGRPDRRDLVVIFPGVRLHGDWLTRMRAAAAADTAVATVSAMLTADTHSPTPLRGDPVADAELVTRHSDCVRPRVSRPVAGCVLLRRPALDLAAALVMADAGHATSWLAEYAEHCASLGLAHVLADDVLADGGPAAVHPGGEAELDARFPHRAAARELDDEDSGPLQRALRLASRGHRSISVTVDGRSLGPHRNGTWVHALELIAALGRRQALELRVVTPPDIDPSAQAVLEEISGLTLLTYGQAAAGGQPVTDIVHRPSQVFSPDDLTLLVPLGRRVVITQQDLISYRIGGYHDSPEAWLAYRRTTRAALSAADHVVFFSERARADACVDDLVGDSTTTVSPIGVDNRAVPLITGGERPSALTGEAPFLLCLGADLKHKNLAFAERLTSCLVAEHGWPGRVVMAGSSERQHDRPDVVVLGPVSESEKAWLLVHAAAVLYPSLYEGFGLVPFEAGAAGTPCLFAHQTAMAETLPLDAASLVPWDVPASAARVMNLLTPGPRRDTHVELLRSAGGAYNWDMTAASLVQLYERLVAQAPREARRGGVERLAAETRLADSERLRIEEWQRYEAFRDQIGADGIGLVGPGGVLRPPDQRALLALLSKECLRRPVLAAVHRAYAGAKRVRRR